VAAIVIDAWAVAEVRAKTDRPAAGGEHTLTGINPLAGSSVPKPP